MRAWTWIAVPLALTGCGTSSDSAGAGAGPGDRHLETPAEEGNKDLGGGLTAEAGGGGGGGVAGQTWGAGGTGGTMANPAGGSAGTADAGTGSTNIPVACVAWHDSPAPKISTSVADSNGMISAVRARESLHFGLLPTTDSIRLDDFFNYYRTGASAPSNVGGQEPTVEMALRSRTVPTQLDLLVKVTAPPRATPRSVLTVLVDTTPSMAGNPLVRAGYVLAALGKRMLPGDSVAVMTTDPEQPQALLEVKGPGEELASVGKALATSENADVTSALKDAFSSATTRFDPAAYNRVLIITDGAEPTSALPTSVIGDAAAKGIFVVGVGVGPTTSYRERLLGQATADGRGSYVFVDKAEEAERLFVNRYDELMGIAYDNVRLELELPYYLHRVEEPSSSTVLSDQARDQYLPPGTSLTFLFRLEACDKTALSANDSINAIVSLKDLKANQNKPFSGSTPAKPQPAGTAIAALDKALAIKSYVEALRSKDLIRVNRALTDAKAAADAAASKDGDITEIQGQLGLLLPLVQP